MMTWQNQIIDGQEVPTELYQVVLICDAHHKGTEVYAIEEEGSKRQYRFVSLDLEEVTTANRCLLVRLTNGASVEGLPEPYGCDLDHPEGLALVGLDIEDPFYEKIAKLGEILWDSAVRILT